MKLFSRFLCAAFTACLLTSCPNERKLAWSPDGHRGVMAGAQGLQILDPEGKLGPVIASTVKGFAWLPDNHGLLVTRIINVKSWPEAKAILPPSEIEQVERLAKALPSLLQAAVTLSGGSDDLDVASKTYGLNLFPRSNGGDNFTMAALMAADREVLRAILKEAKQKEDTLDISSDGLPISELQLIHLADNGEPMGEPQTLERTLRPLGNLSVQPQGKWVAYCRGEAAVVRDLASGSTWEVPNAHVANCVWSLKGDALHTMEKAGEDDSLGIMALTTRTLSFANGKWTASDPVTLVDMMLQGRDASEMRVLPDERILFAAHEVRLEEAKFAPAFFYLVDPSTKKISRIPTKSDDLPPLEDGWSVSASGRSVAIAQNETGIVAVVDLSSGAVELIAQANGWTSKTPPEWRGEELYFASATGKEAAHPDLMRWKHGSANQIVSGSWPDEMRDGLMEKKKSETGTEAK